MKPVLTLTQAKAHLRVEHEFDDELISTYAEAAVDRTLQEIGLAGVLERDHVTETTRTTFGFLYPVEEIVSVEKLNATGTWVVVPPAEYHLCGTIEERQVLEIDEEAGHVAGSDYRVTWKAGFGPNPPAWFRMACYFLIGHYYENRSSVLIGQGVSAVEVPMGFIHLCRPHRRWFFA